jgi:hypothetical protein
VGKLTLWQGVQDQTCPAGNAQKIAQVVKGTRVELFQDEGHCALFGQIQNLNKELIMWLQLYRKMDWIKFDRANIATLLAVSVFNLPYEREREFMKT